MQYLSSLDFSTCFICFFLPYMKIMHENGAEVNRMKETYYCTNTLLSWLFHFELVKAAKYLNQAINSL